jgi:virulence-associated protein VapD
VRDGLESAVYFFFNNTNLVEVLVERGPKVVDKVRYLIRKLEAHGFEFIEGSLLAGDERSNQWRERSVNLVSFAMGT